MKKQTMIIPQINFTKTLLSPKRRKLRKSWKFYNGNEVRDYTRKILYSVIDIYEGKIITVIDCFGKKHKAKCEATRIYNDPFTHKQRVISNATDTQQSFAFYNLSYNNDDRHCWVCDGTNHVTPEMAKLLRK